MNDADAGGRPNVVLFHVDNLGYGELGCYGGGVLRGADTRRLDQFAAEGCKLLNYAPEAQCAPTRSALMTGRYSVRSGNHTVPFPGSPPSGLVAWERTQGDLFSESGYATMCLGKWHIGSGDGRWPTDHGFDEWYGPEGSYEESLWAEDPWYDPGRDPVSYLHDARKGASPDRGPVLTKEVKVNVDVEYQRRAFRFIEDNAQAGRPFFLYYNHSLMHLPVIPREDYRGRSGNGDFADCLLQMDGDFGDLLDRIDELGLRDNTIVVFAGDNGAEEMLLDRGTSGFWEGSYFTGAEGSLRTPCLVRWPGRIPAGWQSNEIVHVTDWFTTLVTMAGLKVPEDRVIDGIDQSAFLYRQQDKSSREGFPYWVGDRLYGVKWQDFKLVLVQQQYFTDPAPDLGFPHIVNLMTDPKEREPYNYRYLHSWTTFHFGKLLRGFQESVQREPLIPLGAPLDYVPQAP